MRPSNILVKLNILLAVVNLWALVMKVCLVYFRSIYVLYGSTSQEFVQRGFAQPEPFEVPLYFFITIFFVLILKFCSHFLSIKLNSGGFFLNIILFFFLLGFFLINLGPYPLAHELYTGLQFAYNGPARIYFHMYLGFVAFSLLQIPIIQKYCVPQKRLVVIPFIIVGSVIALLTFEAGFPMSGHDYSYFFGPVWEITHGKTIYTEAPSQYGFLSILILALLHRMSIVQIWYLPALVWIFYIVQYFLYFSIVMKLSRSIFLSLVALFSVLTINYFSLYHLPASYPQIGPMRWLPMMIALWVLLMLKKINHHKMIFALVLLSLWFVDSGIALFLAFFVTLTLLTLQGQIKWRSLLQSGATFLFFLFVILLMINVFHLVFGFKLINYVAMFSSLRLYSQAGFAMLPLPDRSYLLFFILVYFASIVYFFTGQGKRDFERMFILLMAQVSFFSSLYFIGRSHPHNLFHVALFPLLTFFCLISLIWKRLNNPKAKAMLLLTLVVIFIIWPAYQRQEVIGAMVMEKVVRLKTGQGFSLESKKILGSKYADVVSLIKRAVTNDKIVILADDDAYLYYLTDKGNLLDYNSQLSIVTKSDLEKAFKRIGTTCPDRIVGECQLFGACRRAQPFSVISIDIQPLLLAYMQKKCALWYKPLTCEQGLCIAQAEDAH